MIDIKNYFDTSSTEIKKLSKFSNEILLISKKIIECKKNNKKVLVVGNGGSCADADHFVGELQCTYKKKDRPPIPSISLGGNPASITAWSNDFGYESYFKRQLQVHGNPGDILILLTSSGGKRNTSNYSSNLILAAEEAIKKNIYVISLVGKTGGELKKISNTCIHVENNFTSFVQESHMSILHCICEYLDTEL